MEHEVTQLDSANLHWSQRRRVGEAGGELKRVANAILLGCGGGSILDVGSGNGALVSEFLDRGVNAFGVNVSNAATATGGQPAGRVMHGTALALPLDDLTFETVVAIDCLEYLAPEEISSALREIHRVAQKNVFLRVATAQSDSDRQLSTVENRRWWEERCFDAGFRKHPAYYKLNDYESLDRDDPQIFILLEKLPQGAAFSDVASVELAIHADMLRKAGALSDACVIRYHLASGFVKPGDRVLDAGCGVGYGMHVINATTRAGEIRGIDNNELAIGYAKKNFPDSRASYGIGVLPDALTAYADDSMDLITSFRMLEEASDPLALLREFHRILVPGGRMLVSVRNDWRDGSDEHASSGDMRVYDWSKLRSEVCQFFILETAYAQSATRYTDAADETRQGNACSRVLQQVDITESAPAGGEWWLMVGMKSPLEPSPEYRERVFENFSGTRHPSIRYSEAFGFPWLMYSMVNVSYRLRNKCALEDLCRSVMERTRADSNDYKGALCVRAYLVLGEHERKRQRVQDILQLIDDQVKCNSADEMALRWRVSLLFVKGKLYQALGELSLAANTYEQCASLDVRDFGVHLATKTTEASFLGGRIALSMGDAAQARARWTRGIEIGNYLLGVSIEDILINRDHPNLFNHGDGVREYTVAWDNIARCANGLALLAEGRGMDESLLQGSFQTEYAVVTRDLLSCREMLAVAHQSLEERTQLVAESIVALETVTGELSDARGLVAERSALLQKSRAVLGSQTEELIHNRRELVERTERLVEANLEIGRLKEARVIQSEDLTGIRGELVERTERLVDANLELVRRTEALEQISGDLEERTGFLEQANDELSQIKNELNSKTSELEIAQTALGDSRKLLEMTRAEVVGLRQRPFPGN